MDRKGNNIKRKMKEETSKPNKRMADFFPVKPKHINIDDNENEPENAASSSSADPPEKPDPEEQVAVLPVPIMEGEEKGQGASDQMYKTPRSGTHYTFHGNGLYSCNKCQEEIISKGAIKSHCRKVTCYPELTATSRLAKQTARQKKPEVYRGHSRDQTRRANDAENEGLVYGNPPLHKCSYLDCEFAFHSKRKLQAHENTHRSNATYHAGGFFSAFKEKIKFKQLKDSQEAADSQGSTTSSELRRTQNLIPALQFDRQSGQCTYFVVIVDKEAEHLGLINYLRSISDDPKKEIFTYVGKIALSSHEIAADHEKHESSSIVDLCKTGEKIAYLVRRNPNKTAAAKEKEEAFWTLVAKYRKVSEDSLDSAQWRYANKILDSAPTLTLDKDTMIEAQQLARSNHSLICLKEDCPRRKDGSNHSGGGRKYFGRYHIEQEDVEKLRFSFS